MVTGCRVTPTKYLPERHNIIDCHFVFDITLNRIFTRKTWFVAIVSRFDILPSTVYSSSVVSQETVCTALLLAAPNQLDRKCCDPCGDYLNALVAERFALKLGTNMATIQGKLWLLIAPSTVWKAPVGLGRTPLLVHQIGWVMFLAEPMTVSTCRQRSGQMGTSTSIGPTSSLRWRSSNSWLCCRRCDGTHQKILHTERRYLLGTEPIPWQ